MGIDNNKYNQRVPKPLVLVKEVGKGKANTRRVDVLNPLISPIDLLEVLLVVGAMDMVALHLGRKANCLLTSKRKRILELRQDRNSLR
jgi:hypothetical protein